MFVSFVYELNEWKGKEGWKMENLSKDTLCKHHLTKRTKIWLTMWHWRKFSIIFLIKTFHQENRQQKNIWKFIEKNEKSNILRSWKRNFFWYFFSPFFYLFLIFSYLLFGHFLLLVIKNKNWKISVWLEIPQMKPYFKKLYRTQCPSHTPSQSHHKMKNKKWWEGKRKSLNYTFFLTFANCVFLFLLLL